MSQQEVKPTETKLMYAIKELLNTEKDYVNDLAILIEVNSEIPLYSRLNNRMLILSIIEIHGSD